MNRIFEAALEVDQFCRARAWSFCIIGGVAVRQAGRLDERLIFRELEPLLELKGVPEAAARLREILRKAQ